MDGQALDLVKYFTYKSTNILQISGLVPKCPTPPPPLPQFSPFLQIFAGLSKHLPVFLLGTENIMWDNNDDYCDDNNHDDHDDAHDDNSDKDHDEDSDNDLDDNHVDDRDGDHDDNSDNDCDNNHDDDHDEDCDDNHEDDYALLNILESACLAR